MNGAKFQVNENLRSISAIVAAQNNQENPKKSLMLGSKFRKDSGNGTKLYRSSLSWNFHSPKDTLPSKHFAVTKAKTHLFKSSKVAPCNHNVFYFDDRSDLTITDVLADGCGPTREDRRNTKKLKTKRRSKCIGIFVCLLGIIVIGIVTAVVLVVHLFVLRR